MSRAGGWGLGAGLEACGAAPNKGLSQWSLFRLPPALPWE